MVTTILDNSKILSSDQLNEMMSDRDWRIKRTILATQARKNYVLTGELQLPDELKTFGQPEIDSLTYQSYINGFIIKSNDGRLICSYGNMGALASLYTNIVYRGELKDYGETSGYSTLGRNILLIKYHTEEEKYLHYFIQSIKISLLHSFLMYFKQYREFPFGTPLNVAIAQHYGMETYYLDFTDDIKVALFFASCKYTENNIYDPIAEDDLRHIGQFGVLYSKSIMGTFEGIEPIGSQPFCRCNRQRGYYLNTHGKSGCWDYRIGEDSGFSKMYFVRTPELSERLCEEFDHGRKLFPADGLSSLGGAVNKIQQTREIPIELFLVMHDQFAKELLYRKEKGYIANSLYEKLVDKDRVRSMIQGWGYQITKQLNLHLSEIECELIDKMNQDWNPEEFAESEGIAPSPAWILK